MEDILNRAKRYLEIEDNPVFRKEVADLIKAKKMGELNDRFWRELDFGTGGLRGVIGGGDNRINTYTIRKATQGLANYIKNNTHPSKRSVVISYDSRRYSRTFAEDAASVMATNGITAWIFTSLHPTPMLSYAVRNLKACAGIMITASHNPAQYNGYKVYWSDGAQIVAPHDKGIIEEVRKISGEIPAMEFKDALISGHIIEIDQDVDDSYCRMVKDLTLNSSLMDMEGSRLKIVYTPLHGTGTVPVETILKDMGFNVKTVPEQRNPDANFPTVEYPNPEVAPALKMAIDLARKEKANLVMATDPDADRLGIAVPDKKEWKLLTGNQLGALLVDYIFRVKKEQNRLPQNSAFINTIVTSELQNRIAEFYGVTSFRVLTGFKYIGEKIRQFESDGSYLYMFGGEESYGYLVGTEVRDKDAVSAAAITAEMTLWNAYRGMSVLEHLNAIWKQFGYFEEALVSRDFLGQEGNGIMEKIMEDLRNNPPETIADMSVNFVRDFREKTTLTVSSGTKDHNIDLPSSNVLQFVLNDESLVTARPSGTEPKIKFYISCISENSDDLSLAKDEARKKICAIEEWINSLINSAGA